MKENAGHPRENELRAIYLLIGECCELGADPLLWRAHMLTKLNAMFGAASSIMVDAVFDPQMPGIGARADTTFSADQYSHAEQTVLADCIKNMPVEENPLGPNLLKDFPTNCPTALARKERICDREWRNSGIVTKYFAPVGWYDMMMAMLPKANGFQCVNFSRERGAANFNRRQSRLLQTFAQEIMSISDVRLASLEGNSLLSLPPRERQVLIALSEGDDEKQVALLLGISRSTVHEYVRRLFQRYNVNSRSELLINSARQIHAHRIAEIMPSSVWVYRRGQ